MRHPIHTIAGPWITAKKREQRKKRTEEEKRWRVRRRTTLQVGVLNNGAAGVCGGTGGGMPERYFLGQDSIEASVHIHNTLISASLVRLPLLHGTPNKLDRYISVIKVL